MMLLNLYHFGDATKGGLLLALNRHIGTSPASLSFLGGKYSSLLERLKTFFLAIYFTQYQTSGVYIFALFSGLENNVKVIGLRTNIIFWICLINLFDLQIQIQSINKYKTQPLSSSNYISHFADKETGSERLRDMASELAKQGKGQEPTPPSSPIHSHCFCSFCKLIDQSSTSSVFPDKLRSLIQLTSDLSNKAMWFSGTA